MPKFTGQLLLSDAAELDELIFKKGQDSLQKELNDFVEAFETKKELLELDSLAKTYVQLTNCDQKLKSAISSETLETLVTQSSAVHDSMVQIMKSLKDVQANKVTVPFLMEREAYLNSREERKKMLEDEIRKDSDKIDEYYAKKTRDSIYQNLVGGSLHPF